MLGNCCSFPKFLDRLPVAKFRSGALNGACWAARAGVSCEVSRGVLDQAGAEQQAAGVAARDKVSRYLEVYIRRITWRGRSLRAVSGDVRPNGDVWEQAERVSSCLLGLNMLGGSLKGTTNYITQCMQPRALIYFKGKFIRNQKLTHPDWSVSLSVPRPLYFAILQFCSLLCASLSCFSIL